MNKLILCLVIFILGYTSASMELRSYIEQKRDYDDYYYTDCGLDLRLRNTHAEFNLTRGVMFSGLEKPFIVGNHEWMYTGYNVRFMVGMLSIRGEILTEITPFEGNDFGLDSPFSTQSVGLGFHDISIDRSKHTNGDFYTHYRVSSSIVHGFTDTRFYWTLHTKGARGTAKMETIWSDEVDSLELRIAQWWKFNIVSDLQLAIRLQGFGRYRFLEKDVVPGYSISMGLIAV